MSAAGDLDAAVYGNFRLGIIVFHCHICKGCQYVYLCHSGSRFLYLFQHGRQAVPNFGENALFQAQDTVFCTEDLVFHVFQFFGDKALTICQGLFPDIIGRDQIIIGPGDFQVIPEYPVIADLQAFDACPFPFSLENLVNDLCAAVHNAALAIQFFVESIPDDAAVLQGHRRIVYDGIFHQCRDTFQRRDLLFQCVQQPGIPCQLLQLCLQFRQLLCCHGKGFQITGRCLLVDHTCHKTFQVIDVVQQVTHFHEDNAFLDKRIYRIQTSHDLYRLHQRLFQPGFQQTFSHSSSCIIQQPEQ